MRSLLWNTAMRKCYYLCITFRSSLERTASSPIRLLGQWESSIANRAFRQLSTVSSATMDVGLHNASIHIPGSEITVEGDKNTNT